MSNIYQVKSPSRLAVLSGELAIVRLERLSAPGVYNDPANRRLHL